MKTRNAVYISIIVASSVFFFIPYLGAVHLFDWDEINFAESAREMIVTGDYSRVMINFQPFWEKPPLFFWLQTLSMHLFGITEFAARFPNAIVGIVSLLTLYIMGRKLKDERFGFLWALAYLGSFLPHLYFKSGIIDPLFNYFIFMGIYFLYKEVTQKSAEKPGANMALAGLFIGLANLTKGPVGLLIFLLCAGVYWITKRFTKITNLRNSMLFLLSFAAVSFFWFGPEIMKHGFWFLKEFITYQVQLFATPVAGHKEPFYYHFIVVLLGCFPISIFALPIIATGKSDDGHSFARIMRILFWVVIILFSIVTTKIVHYSSLTYYPLSFLAALFIYRLVNGQTRLPKYVFIFLLIIGSVFALLLTALPLLADHKDLLIPYLKDPFAVASLQASVHWGGFEFIIGLLYLIAMVVLIVRIKRNANLNNFAALFYTTALCLFFYLAAVVPKIEGYSQGPAVNFYKSMAGKNVDAISVGYYSYAQFFYFEKPGPSIYGSQKQEEDSLLNGNIQRPAYFITKVTNTNFPTEHIDCKLLRQEGGFLFYERLPD